jgi:prepilin-type processing-associated H-X9-DG protein
MKTDDDPEGGGRDPDSQWARVSADLRAYREAQRRAWGDIDEAAIARYLEGEATEGERGRVEQAMRDYPRVRECVQILREVMSEEGLGREDRTASAGEMSSRPISQAPSNWGHPRPQPGLDPPVGGPPGGLNLVHVLVLTAIAASVLVMTLTAVESAREAARRAQCVNNLKQITLASANYESDHGSFPMGNRYIDNTSFFSQSLCSSSSWFGHSAFGFILPYMEGNARYNSINFSFQANSNRNTTTYFSKVNSYVCPSDLPAPPYTSPWSQTSYGMSRGTQENIYGTWAVTSFPDPSAPNPNKCNAALGNGMFGAEDGVRISMVTDGISTTTLFGETARWPDDPAKGFNWWHFTAAFGTANTGGYFSGDFRPETGAFTYPDINAPPDRTGAIMNYVFCRCGSGNCIPTDWLDPKCTPLVRMLGQFAFRSHHPGGANFAFADGSVKFLKNTINTKTYMALGTRAGGEDVSADQY